MAKSADPKHRSRAGPHADNRRNRAPGSAERQGAGRWWPVALILVAGLATYANSLSHPFIFDDFGSVVRNAHIRDLTDLGRVLTPPLDTPVAHRPLVNLSFAINYAIGELNVVGYRVVNLALHLACALAIFGLVRRTLDAYGGAATGARATGLACAIALVWTVHPLNSEVVDYVSQRSESMMALCYLWALYASVRAHQSPRATRWLVASVVACAAGMACKESMVTAPVMIALYDIVFVTGAIGLAVRTRWRFYAALAGTWVLLAASFAARGAISTGGFSSAQATWWTYLLNQTVMVTRYFRLAFWPSSLVNYYGWTRPLTLGDVWIEAACLTLVFLAAVALFVRKPRLGFLGVWVFVVLAPTSSIVSIAAEVGAERRMYLPLVGLVALVVIAAEALWRRVTPAVVAIVIVLSVVTFARNREYASALTMARTVLARWPTPMAHHLVGAELSFAGQQDEAIAELRIAARDYAPSRFYLGQELVKAGRLDEAVTALQAFVRDEPRAPVVPSAHRLMAEALVRAQRVNEAIPHYRAFLSANPGSANEWSSLGLALISAGKAADAAEAFGRAVSASPGDGHLRQNFARALLDTGRVADAAVQAQQAVTLLPAEPGGHDVLARVFVAQGKMDEARRAFEHALQIDPNYMPAQDGLRVLRAK